jgi:hypothetical protein
VDEEGAEYEEGGGGEGVMRRRASLIDLY